MSKKDTIILLSPAICFALVGAAALLISADARGFYDPDDARRDQQKFEAFEQRVHSGELHLTPDAMLEAMRHNNQYVKAERELSVSTAQFVQTLAWSAPIGIL